MNCLRATYRAASSEGEEKEGGSESREDQKGGLQHTTTITMAANCLVSQQTEPGNGILWRMRKRHCELIISINIPHHSQTWANLDTCQVYTVHNTQTVT